MLVCGVGGVTWAEQEVPSGPAALLVATVPLWMTLIDGAVLRRRRVGRRTVAGLVLGVAGVVVLIDPLDALSTSASPAALKWGSSETISQPIKSGRHDWH